MEIQELILKHYGKFHNHSISLKSGINIIYGGNEAGKSTIHSFIRAMFFGLNRSRGIASRTDEYQIRQPWDTPGAFMGSMRVKENGEIFRIDRCFDRSTVPLQVVSESRKQVSKAPEKTMDWLLQGMGESVFSNTFYIAQTKCETEAELANELRHYLLNSEQSLDAKVDITAALQALRKKKKQLEQTQKNTNTLLKTEISQQQIRLDMVEKELELLKNQYREEFNQPWDHRHPERMERIEEKSENSRSHSRGQSILEIVLFLAALCAGLGAYFLEGWQLKTFLGIFTGVFLLMILPVHFLLGPDEDNEEEEFRDAFQGKQLDIKNQETYLLKQIQRLENEYSKLKNEMEALHQGHAGGGAKNEEVQALDMAIERICTLSSGISQTSGSELRERTSEILKELTNGAYDNIAFDDTFEINVHTRDRVLGLHQLSRGTLQQIYFAFRMAAGEKLCPGRLFPVILDETFAMYDDNRLEATLRWLKNSGRQVILFTCQKREREILRKIEMEIE